MAQLSDTLAQARGPHSPGKHRVEECEMKTTEMTRSQGSASDNCRPAVTPSKRSGHTTTAVHLGERQGACGRQPRFMNQQAKARHRAACQRLCCGTCHGSSTGAQEQDCHTRQARKAASGLDMHYRERDKGFLCEQRQAPHSPLARRLTPGSAVSEASTEQVDSTCAATSAQPCMQRETRRCRRMELTA